MRKIIKATVNGNTLLFDNDLSEQEYVSLQALADSPLFKDTLNFKDVKNVKLQFIETVKRELEISLEPIIISHIIRIK